MLRDKKPQGGFTLIELIIAVAIIGVLASMVTNAFRNFQMQARQSSGKSMLSAIVNAEEAFRAEYESYTSDLAAVGFAPQGTLIYQAGVAPGYVAPAPGYQGLAQNAAQNTTASAAVCQPSKCAMLSPGAPGQLGVGAFTATTAPTATTFVAVVSGWVGGTTEDDWKMGQDRVLTRVEGGDDGEGDD